ncbi:SIS domain-containing protein [Loigolactobacillus coryniformis]|uniref:SIS domain-containing protein n=1 Tax=Loigolactobacillus coryniformis TaxID=1610 RepID=UPI001C5F9490|nr:SIS domain-containing protein [Loigolactobacillus coryniformis]MBW4803741.1 SIS domain-containing protein [Loigolactobacillus coryniformis subsp. torquens]MBW4806452.1 SIS domain-containing protein [Loigolactobacillus coryniformis subsp. torquens]
MFDFDKATLDSKGATITTTEIKQEPDLWQETIKIFKQRKSELDQFLAQITQNIKQPVRVIFTGAGSSAYVGDTITPYLNLHADRAQFRFEAIDSTKLVSTPAEYFEPNTPTILVSFARSGDSPESIAAVNLAEQLVEQLWQITITCNPDGQLAQHAQSDANNFVLLTPIQSNDKGFAMTGSFSCMTLSALLTFDTISLIQKETYVTMISAMGQEVIDREAEIKKIVDLDFNRIIYLGSGGLAGLTREAQLKVLELTAGQIATVFDSSMGFRHGPKSFVNDHTLVFDFVNNEIYPRLYDIDILNEVADDKIALQTTSVGIATDNNFVGPNFTFKKGNDQLPEAYLALPDIMFAQTLALFTSIKVGNTPDTPSATGTVNRVVKGVTIHPFTKEG